MRTLLPIHFRLGVLVLSASCAGSSRGAKHLEFTQILLQDSAHQIILGVLTLLPPAGNSCVTGGTLICCWLPETLRHCRHTEQVPPQLQQQHWDNPDRSLQSQNLSHQGCTCEETTSITSITKTQAMTWLNSPQHTFQHPCCFTWVGWLRPTPSASSRGTASITWIGWSGDRQQTGSTAPVTSHQWPHAGSPSAVILIGKGWGIWRIGAWGCFAAVFLMVLGRKGMKRPGPRLGSSPRCAPQGQRTKRAPRTAGHGRGKLGHTLRTAVETLQHQHGSYQLSENTGLLSSLLNEKTIKRQLNTK